MEAKTQTISDYIAIKRVGHIRDAVLGDIELTEAEMGLAGDKNMQRLTRLKQLGLAYLVYPGANHTRFEHSLGTMKMTGELARHTGCEDVEELEIVGMLHDIGHAPLSHLSDALLSKYLHTTHEKVGEEIVRNSSIKDKIVDAGFSIKKIIDYFNGKGRGAIITGALGSDRLDYLTRDSYYTGAAYGVTDFSSIINRVQLYRDRPAVLESGVFIAEDMLMGRYAMYSSVYYHHTELIAEGMYHKAAVAAFDSKELDPGVLTKYDDWQMLLKMQSCRASGELTERILQRRLFKRAADKMLSHEIGTGEVEEALEKAGLKKDEYVVVVSRVKGWGDDIDVVDRDGKLVGNLRRISPVVKTLESLMKKRRELIVACDRKHIEKTARAVKHLLG